MVNKQSSQPSVLDVVALLADLPQTGLPAVRSAPSSKLLDHATALIEFSDDDGRAYAIVRCPTASLLVGHYEPEAA
jgi:hypothetical protein